MLGPIRHVDTRWLRAGTPVKRVTAPYETFEGPRDSTESLIHDVSEEIGA